MTPIFFHEDQRVDYDFISVNKIPQFVEASGRAPHTFKPLAKENLYRVHKPSYVDGVFEGTLSNGFSTKDPQINRSLLASTGSMIAAARYAMAFDGVACSASQGFHHAGYAYGGGYCTFNGLMLTAATLLDSRRVEHVLIIDGDAHYGDGTVDIIERLEMQMDVTHITRGEGIGEQMESWSTSMWLDWAMGLIEERGPGIILYQAGADAWIEDPYGAGYLDRVQLAKRDRGIFIAAKESGVPLVWNLAGGYSTPIGRTLAIHTETLAQSDEVFYGR
jgi:acetoin utilization deacetylase AcuC-like enzyme